MTSAKMREPGENFEAPLSLYETRVMPEWLDYNSHMSEAFYVLVFGYATDALLDRIGMDAKYHERSRSSVYTLEAHVNYLREVGEGEPLRIVTQVLDLDPKRLQVFHSMYRARQGELIATEELLLMHVDTTGPRSTPFASEVFCRLEAIRDLHTRLPRPEQAGHCIAIRH